MSGFIEHRPSREDLQHEISDLRAERNALIEILLPIAAEFETDPQSVVCFDLRVVKRAVIAAKWLRQLPPWPAGGDRPHWEGSE